MSTRDQTLSGVLEIIPAECYRNPTWKGVAYVLLDWSLHAAVLFGLAASDSPWLLLPLWVVSALTVSGLFILGHDAAHGALFSSKRLCYLFGQLCFLPSLHLFSAWVLGHNRIHHGHTVRQEMDFVWHPLSPEQYRSLSWLGRLRHRAEWSRFGAGLYYLRDVWWNKMIYFTAPPKLADEMRRDRRVVGAFFVLATLGLGAAGFAVYGTLAGAVWMWLKLLIVPWLGFNWVIGWAVYMHHIDDRIQWFARRNWTKFKGQMQGTTIMRVPAVLNLFFHHIFLHVPHHVDMRIPFYGLPEASRAILEHFPEVVRERRLRWSDYVGAVRSCKLYDFERGRWLTYGEAAAEGPEAEPRAA